ncbi:hypothetical protein DFH06DRAFT_265072 [Mycena polygramma]|nr:hypothetical protein DFH06DRAFT_265072 [Mycena polygramma]
MRSQALTIAAVYRVLLGRLLTLPIRPAFSSALPANSSRITLAHPAPRVRKAAVVLSRRASNVSRIHSQRLEQATALHALVARRLTLALRPAISIARQVNISSTCPANTFSAPGASSCTACPNASTSNPGSASCSQHCPAGKFIDGTLCTSCAAGTYSGADATTCSTCPVNTFSAAGASSCTACPSGGTCKAGSTHSSQCAPPACPAGKYLDYGRCKTCPRGTFSSKPDSLYCEDCPVDTYSDSGATHCTNCDTGYGCEARSAPGQCKRKPGCPPGQALSNRVCNNCPRNTYSIGGHSPCIVCPKGYSAPRGSSSCTAHPTPSHYPRAQEVLTCPRDHMLCPVYGSTSLECIDVRNSLESCGGCVEVGTNSVGQDCSAIKNVVDVRCNHGRCEVSKCRANFEVSVTHDSCVVPRTARRPRTK